jgi:hypothetical protein
MIKLVYIHKYMHACLSSSPGETVCNRCLSLQDIESTVGTHRKSLRRQFAFHVHISQKANPTFVGLGGCTAQTVAFPLFHSFRVELGGLEAGVIAESSVAERLWCEVVTVVLEALDTARPR